MSEVLASCVVPMVPASCLLPNAQRRTHYHVWSEEAANLRGAAALMAAVQRVNAVPLNHVFDPVQPTTTLPVRLRVVIAWPKGRKRCDFQAAVHATKALVDGLVDAGWMRDDAQVVGMDVRQERADDQGSVSVEMLRAD